MRAMNPPDTPPNSVTTTKDSLASPLSDRDQNSPRSPSRLKKSNGTSFYTFRSRDVHIYKGRTNSGVGLQELVDGCSAANTKRHSNFDEKNGREVFGGFARSDTTSKLELFVVCRLGTYVLSYHIISI